jgi:hypothetical protein
MARRERVSGTRSLVTTAVVALVASGLVFLLVAKLTSSPDAKNNLGDPVFEVGPASYFATRTPLLFQALQGAGDRDIYVNHLGPKVKEGWIAFEAHARGEARNCFLRWSPAAKRFTDPCTKRTYGPDPGPDFVHYKTVVGSKGTVVVDFRATSTSATTTTTTTSTSTTSL